MKWTHVASSIPDADGLIDLFKPVMYMTDDFMQRQFGSSDISEEVFPLRVIRISNHISEKVYIYKFMEYEPDLRRWKLVWVD